MSIMGGSCSTQKRRPWEIEYYNENQRDGYFEDENVSKNCPRHSVVSPIPDYNIPLLFPKSENCITAPDGCKSPKSLATLCVETLCRSIPRVEGGLPAGIPQDCINDIVESLAAHSAFNASTLKLFGTCELESLDLSKSRGVSDEWFQKLHSIASTTQDHSTTLQHRNSLVAIRNDGREQLDGRYNPREEVEEDASSACSTTSFMSACSSASAQQLVDHQHSLIKRDGGNYASHLVDPLASSPASSKQTNFVTVNIRSLDLRGANDLTDWGLLQLSALPNVEEVFLDNCHGILGRGMMVFTTSSMLHTLSFINCRRLTDEAIVTISHLKTLKYLYLDGCRCLTDQSLAGIANLTNIQRLDLSRCDQITDDGLTYLANLYHLEELLLGWCRLITDQGVNTVTSHNGRNQKLHTLGLARTKITDESLLSLIRLKSLNSLDLNGCTGLSSAELGRLVKYLPDLRDLDVSYCPGILRSPWQSDSLQSLNLCYSAVKDSHLGRLGSFPELEHLNLDSCYIEDLGIAFFVDNNVAPRLQSIELADTDVSDNCLEHLAKLPELSTLSLLFCDITNVGLRQIGKMTKLEVLNLDSRDISDFGLKHIENLDHLKSLDLLSSRITDSGCYTLSKIKSLETLALCGGGIGDVGCSHLSRLQNLNVLNLSQNEGITNRGAAALSSLKKLTSLNLSHTRVSADALVHFNRLKNLKSLALYGCGQATDRDRLVKLQNRLPNLRCVRTEKVPDDQGIVQDMSEHYSSSSSSSDMDIGYD